MSPCLSFIMLYVWARKNPTAMVNFFELFQFRAPVLPWAMLLMVIMFGYSPKYDLCGMAAGHIYYFIEDVIPKLPETEDVKILKPPRALVRLCEYLQIHDFNINEEEVIFEEAEAAANQAMNNEGAENAENL